MDTEALAIGAIPELSRTSTAAPVLKPAGTNAGGTAPVGKVSRVAKIWGGAAGEELPPPPPPPPPQAASNRQAAAAPARPPSLLWDCISSPLSISKFLRALIRRKPYRNSMAPISGTATPSAFPSTGLVSPFRSKASSGIDRATPASIAGDPGVREKSPAL